MFNSKFSGLLTGLLIVAIIAIVVLIGYFGWSVYNKYYLDAKAQEVVESFEKNQGNNDDDGDRAQIGDVEGTPSIYDQNSANPQKYYGYDVIGTISIPKISVQYPILNKATTQSIKVAVAYLSGAGVNKVRKYCYPRSQLQKWYVFL